MAQRHCGSYAILLCRFGNREEQSRGNTVEQRKIARVDELEHNVENLTVLCEICGVGRRGREVFSEGSVGNGAEIGMVDVEEHFVAEAEYDDVPVRREDYVMVRYQQDSARRSLADTYIARIGAGLGLQPASHPARWPWWSEGEIRGSGLDAFRG